MSKLRVVTFMLAIAWQLPLQAQGPPGSVGVGGSSRAIALPPSGLQGGVVAQQSSGAAGVSTVSSSVAVSGAFSGSVPGQIVATGAITLSLSDAVKQGLAANLGPLLANDNTRASRAQRLQALSALLPNIAGNLSETVTQVNLAAYGFTFHLPPGLNFSIPSVVGPFSYSQAQASLSQSVYNAVDRRNWKATKELERASVLSAHDARETVVLAVGGLYLQTLADEARVTSQQAQVANAQTIYNQAVTRKEAGTNSKIDVMRSLVELQTEQQRLSSYQADLRKQKIALARAIGVPLGREILLSDVLGFDESAVPEATVEIAAAMRNRPDLKAGEASVHAAEIALSAARGERLPSASVNGDYGVLGPNPANTHGVFAVTGSVNIPIWQGGRVKGDMEQAAATLHERQAQLADARGQAEQDVRDALIEFQTASGQVKLAENNRAYANETLTEARDRFSAGVATTVEVVQAQQQVAGAEADYIASLFSFDLAKLSLARATGDAETNIAGLLKGVHQ